MGEKWGKKDVEWTSAGQNTGVGSLSLLQGIFLTQRSNPGLLHYRQTLYPLSHQGRSVVMHDIKENGFPGGTGVKSLPVMQETWVRSLGREDPLEKEMAAHAAILAWRIPWTEEPGGL